jgi:cupin fold WbuC family metalloprotein
MSSLQSVPGIVLIDAALLDVASEAARVSPRRRRNHNFHPTEDFLSHRLLNAIEPDSYVMPHRHLDPHKDETLLVLRGCLGLLIFDDDGQVIQKCVLAAGSACMGVDIKHGCWHMVIALEPGSVFFEAKAGPYVPLVTAEKAPWAPVEGAAACVDYLETMRLLMCAES